MRVNQGFEGSCTYPHSLTQYTLNGEKIDNKLIESRYKPVITIQKRNIQEYVLRTEGNRGYVLKPSRYLFQ